MHNSQQLLVLGAGFESDGTPNHQTMERAVFAARYQAENPVERVVFSGGYSSIAPERMKLGVSEAEVMAERAVELGLPEDILRLEPNSTTTFSNFTNSAVLLDRLSEVNVVAHNWQMPRALLIGRKALIQTVEPLIVDAEDPIKRTSQERVLFAVSKLLLVGVKPGDTHAVEKRGHIIEAAVGGVGSSARRFASRHHSAFE